MQAPWPETSHRPRGNFAFATEGLRVRNPKPGPQELSRADYDSLLGPPQGQIYRVSGCRNNRVLNR